MLNRILCLIIGYALGLIQSGYLFGKAHGVDIRQHGSGNSGATNTLRVLGTGAGIAVLLLDALKCIVAIIITYFLFSRNNPEYYVIYKLYTAFGVILGHNFPFYLKFKGGKGISATAGLIITFGPLYLVGNLLLFAITFLSTHFVSLGSLVIYGAFLIENIVVGQMGGFNKADVIIPQALLVEGYIVLAIMTALAYFQHRKNIVRLLNHEESKVYLSKKNQKKHAEETKNQKPII